MQYNYDQFNCMSRFKEWYWFEWNNTLVITSRYDAFQRNYHWNNCDNGKNYLGINWFHSITVKNECCYYIISASIRGATSFTTFEKALQYFQDSNKQIFVIGGERLYREALPLADMIYITRIDKDYKCDTFFPYHLLLSHTYSSTPELQYRGLTYKFEIYYQ